LLLSGPVGIGKTQFARLAAKAVLCEDPRERFAPCDACLSCRWYDQKAHPDLKVIESESPQGDETGLQSSGARGDGKEKRGGRQIAVAQIRELSSFLGLTSHRHGKKVVLIITAEDLSASASNAFLKTLEEPPPGVLFFLVSHRPHRILPTVRSRCCCLPMRAPTRLEGVNWLAERGISEPELALAAAGFAPLRALENEKGEQRNRRKAFFEALAAETVDAVGLAAELDAIDLQIVLGWLQTWIYDLTTNRLVGRTRYNLDFAGPLRDVARRTNLPHLVSLYRSLVRQQSRVNHPLNSQLVFEQLLVSYSRCVKDQFQ